MSVTLSEVTRAARAHRAPLAGESAGYLVLAIADQVLSAPRLVEPGEIQLGEDGGLRVLSGRASNDVDAELALRQTLGGLLLVASSGSAALTRASKRTSAVGLTALVCELEAALIPVNRAAARRALARLHRETARALASGVLPAEAGAPQVFPELAVAEPPVADLSPAAVVEVSLAAVAEVSPAAVADNVPVAPAILLEHEVEPETPAIPVVAPSPAEPALPSNWEAILTALCAESPEVDAQEEQELGQEQESEALTVALHVRALPAAEPAPAPAYEEDVDFDEMDAESESAVAPTVVRDAPVVPVVHAFEAAPSALEAEDGLASQIPVEACTRPEPVVLRKSMRPVPAELAQLAELAPMAHELLSRTPTLGSLVAQLPVLSAEELAQWSELVEREPSAAPLAVQPAVEAPQEHAPFACSAVGALAEDLTELAEPIEPTERTPEVSPLAPGVAIVASRKSDIGELLQSFQVADHDSSPGLRRAIKELAELDLTPAPFAALIR